MHMRSFATIAKWKTNQYSSFCRIHEAFRIYQKRLNAPFATNASDDGSSDVDASTLLSLPRQYLRAAASSNYDAATHQRKDVSFDRNGKCITNHSKHTNRDKRNKELIVDRCWIEGDSYHIAWSDGLLSQYSRDWVRKQTRRWKGCTSSIAEIDDDNDGRIFWTGITEDSLRSSSRLSMDFDDALTESGQSRAVRTLYQYGILLVQNTPVSDNGAGIAALASAIGGGSIKNETCLLTNYLAGGSEIMLPRGTDGPLRTLYGTVWSTSSSGQVDGASVADSAYGKTALPLHTDMTYFRDPPGLQIFTMKHPAEQGGESVFGDGFAAANILKQNHPEAFSILTGTDRRYRSIDSETGWHLEANGPVIALGENGSRVVGIRHNDLDRLPDLPPAEIIRGEYGSHSSSSSPAAIQSFYEGLEHAHAAWDAILSDDDFRLEVSLNAGDTIIVANQRCFHGRTSFTASKTKPRSVMGCYVSQDELSSRFRMEGLDQE